MRDHPIPANKVSAGYNYGLPDDNKAQVRRIAEETATEQTTGSAKEVGDLYAA